MKDNLKIENVSGEVDFTFAGFNYNMFFGVIKSKPGDTKGECLLRFDDDQILRMLKESVELSERRRLCLFPSIREKRVKNTLEDLESAWMSLTAWIQDQVKNIVK